MAKRTRGIGNKWVDVCELLNRHDATYIVIGGVAVALHGYVRATKDIDILIPRDIENTKRVLEALGELPWGIAKEMNPEHVDRNPITIVGDDPRVDILKAAQGLNYEAARKSKLTTTIAGTTVPYVGFDDLIRSKTGTNRNDDEKDIRELNRGFSREARRDLQGVDRGATDTEREAAENSSKDAKAAVRGNSLPVGGNSPAQNDTTKSRRRPTEGRNRQA